MHIQDIHARILFICVCYKVGIIVLFNLARMFSEYCLYHNADAKFFFLYIMKTYVLGHDFQIQKFKNRRMISCKIFSRDSMQLYAYNICIFLSLNR